MANVSFALDKVIICDLIDELVAMVFSQQQTIHVGLVESPTFQPIGGRQRRSPKAVDEWEECRVRSYRE